MCGEEALLTIGDDAVMWTEGNGIGLDSGSEWPWTVGEDVPCEMILEASGFWMAAAAAASSSSSSESEEPLCSWNLGDLTTGGGVWTEADVVAVEEDEGGGPPGMVSLGIPGRALRLGTPARGAKAPGPFSSVNERERWWFRSEDKLRSAAVNVPGGV